MFQPSCMLKYFCIIYACIIRRIRCDMNFAGVIKTPVILRTFTCPLPQCGRKRHPAELFNALGSI